MKHPGKPPRTLNTYTIPERGQPRRSALCRKKARPYTYVNHYHPWPGGWAKLVAVYVYGRSRVNPQKEAASLSKLDSYSFINVLTIRKGNTMRMHQRPGVSRLCRHLLMALALVLGPIGVPTITVLAAPTASAGTNTYPSNWATAPMDSIVDTWGEYNRECTSYAAWMLHSVNGFEMPFHDNAVNWGTDAQARGYAVNGTPAVGSIYWTSSPQHVAWVESVNGNGTVTIEDYNSNYAGNWGEHTVATGSASGYIHFKDLSGGGAYADSTYLVAPSGSVYVVAGGAAIPVYSWASVGGSHNVVSVTQQQIDAMPKAPADDTYVVQYGSPSVYVFAGGAPIPVFSWESVGGSKNVVVIPAGAILSDFRQYPADNTYIVQYGSPSVYEVVGGATVPVYSWDSVGGSRNVAVVPSGAVAADFRAYPADDTYVVQYGSPSVYVFAGGAPIPVYSWNSVGGPQNAGVIPAGSIPSDFRQYPADGTYVLEYGSASVYVVAGGSALGVASWEGVGGSRPVAVIPIGSIVGSLLGYPQNGTYVRGYASGDEFVANNGAVTRVTTTPLPSATIVDDWAIVNQLGGTE